MDAKQRKDRGNYVNCFLHTAINKQTTMDAAFKKRYEHVFHQHLFPLSDDIKSDNCAFLKILQGNRD